MYRIESADLMKGGKNIPFSRVMVAVGPNNGGKSQFLRDVVRSISLDGGQVKAVREIHSVFDGGARATFERIIANAKTDNAGNAILDTPTANFELSQLRIHANTLGLNSMEDHTEEQCERLVRSHLMRHLVVHLTTEQRLLHLKKQVNKSPQFENPQTPIEAAFAAGADVMQRIFDRVRGAFERDLVFDRSNFAVGEFCLKESQPGQRNGAEEAPGTVKLSPLDEQGDGIRAFCGIVVTTELIDRDVFIVDEPEAFLHPPQAFLIGRALAEIARDRKRQLIVATHSADVLRGVLSVGVETTIARFSQRSGEFDAVLLEKEQLATVSNDPVLSSSRVLDGLFYDGVVITESDGDVAVYRAVLEQIDRTASIGFVNSYGKQHSIKIARPFRSMGIPTVVAVDFDALRVRHEFRAAIEGIDLSWTTMQGAYENLVAGIERGHAPNVEIAALLAALVDLPDTLDKNVGPREQLDWLRRRLSDIRSDASVWSKLKRGGVKNLDADSKKEFEFIDTECRKNGLFLVPCGEREEWLEPDVDYSHNKRAWTTVALKFLATTSLKADHPLSLFVQELFDFIRPPRRLPM